MTGERATTYAPGMSQGSEPGGRGITAALAEFVVGTRFEGLPAAVVAQAKRCILDCLGVAIRGGEEPLAKAQAALLERAAPRGPATVWAGRRRTGILEAALANGTLGHALDFDDTYQPVPIHSSAPLVPALFALAETIPCNGKDLLAAFAAGCEASIRIGLAVGRSHIEKGWHGTGTFGTFGAAAGAGRLLGLDAGRLAQALGIASVQAAGLIRAAVGTMCKPLHAGKAAMNGLLAACLARDGFTGPPEILTDKQCFGELFGGPTLVPERAVDGLGRRYEMLNISFKPYACCSQTHATADAVRALRGAHNLTPDGVESITLTVNPVAANVAGIPRPTGSAEGKFSLAYVAALALAGEPLGIAGFDPGRVARPALQALCSRVTLEVKPGMGDVETQATIVTKDGRRLAHYVPEARGNPGNPLTDDEIRAKFLDLAGPVLGPRRARRLMRAVLALETAENAGAVARLAGLPASRPR
ncbi:MAG TPA: MmgE/PrpD family protein [Candidatus Sulfotelmatobacter sp.]|nr:MmgE/PrpD family protein [Candidatus Sulfotelmatobacter sp.]